MIESEKNHKKNLIKEFYNKKQEIFNLRKNHYTHCPFCDQKITPEYYSHLIRELSIKILKLRNELGEFDENDKKILNNVYSNLNLK